MRIFFVVGREITYPRNNVLLRAMQRFAEVDVLGVSQKPRSIFFNSVYLIFKALPRLTVGKYDLVFVGFYGHILMLLIGIFTRRPIVFDAFVSTYDTLSGDRKLFASHSLVSKLAFWLDHFACLMAKHILLDTSLHVEYFIRTFDIPIGKISKLPVGCNEDLFYPQDVDRDIDRFEVLYYSTYMPLHGVETVVQAAALLKEHPIRFRLVGDGPTHQRVKDIARQLGLVNVEFIPYLPLEQLPLEISRADVCLGGHFGVSEKAGRVVPGKVYQVLAMARPLIATATPANMELLKHGVSAYLCSPNDPHALAAALLDLYQDVNLRNRLAAGGRKCYLAYCSESIITEQLKSILAKILS